MKMELLLQIQGNMLKKLESYEKTFGEKPKKTKTPLVGGDHPESDISDFCDQDQIKQYQTIVGQLIWLSRLGRFDIAVHVMTMSRFRQQPRIGHLERLKKIVGYLANFPLEPYGSDSMNQTTLTYLTRNMIGRELFMEEQKKKFHMISQNQRGNM